VWAEAVWAWLGKEPIHQVFDKSMCREDYCWPRDDVGSYYCPYWACVSWQRAEHVAPPSQGESCHKCTPGTCNAVNFMYWLDMGTYNKNKDRGKLPWSWDSDSNSYPWEFLRSSYLLLLWGGEEWIFYSTKAQNISLTGWIYSPDTECHCMLCLWGDQHGRPLALESKGTSLLMRLPSQTQERCLAPKRFHQ
jgi:hypothetical protein